MEIANDLKAVVKEGIKANRSFFVLRSEIVKFKKDGGSQCEAGRVLEELRGEFQGEEDSEDVILDLLDYVMGWCSTHHRIWEDA